jgi:poly[(R)-3-hydroxyalkanoate] polymerase subunit PhaC
MTLALSPSSVRGRLGHDVERAMRRGRNGLRFAAGATRPEVGQTPKSVVWSHHKTQLWRYRGDGIRYRPPVVIVHSLVSRSYVLDLYPGNSAVAFLLGSGLDVFLLDWGVPDAAEAENSLETYVDGAIPAAVSAACVAAGSDDVTLLGYCFGGVLSLLACARHPELPIRNLVLMATPVDFSAMPGLTSLVREGRLEPEDVLDETGNVPPHLIENAFRLLHPTGEITQYANLWENLGSDAYLEGFQAMGRWTHDQVPFPGAAFRQTVEQLVRRNALMDGTLDLDGERVDLQQIRCPVLGVTAERDHIVPLPAAAPMPSLVGSEVVDELRLAAGHVGLVAGRAAATVTLPGIAAWIAEHSDRRS